MAGGEWSGGSYSRSKLQEKVGSVTRSGREGWLRPRPFYFTSSPAPTLGTPNRNLIRKGAPVPSKLNCGMMKQAIATSPLLVEYTSGLLWDIFIYTIRTTYTLNRKAQSIFRLI